MSNSNCSKKKKNNNKNNNQNLCLININYNSNSKSNNNKIPLDKPLKIQLNLITSINTTIPEKRQKINIYLIQKSMILYVI